MKFYVIKKKNNEEEGLGECNYLHLESMEFFPVNHTAIFEEKINAESRLDWADIAHIKDECCVVGIEINEV